MLLLYIMKLRFMQIEQVAKFKYLLYNNVKCTQ